MNHRLPILAVLGPGAATHEQEETASRIGSLAAHSGWVVLTGAGMARNAFNVLSATLCVAVGGGAGTLSEVALALKAGIPVWCWRSWGLEPPPGTSAPSPRCFDSAEALLEALKAEMGPSTPRP